MRLTDILNSQCVKVPLEATTKQEAIFELVDVLAAGQGIADACRMELRANVWQREQTRSTGIGHGVAIPHGKCKSLHELCMAIGKVSPPMDFAAIDGKPVELVFLLASPVDQTGPHIQALASISRMLTDPVMRNGIKNSKTAEELLDVVNRYENRVTV